MRFLGLFLILFFPFVVHSHEVAQQDQIFVVGEGEVESEPDQAILNISINTQEPTLVEAKKLADEKYKSVLAQIVSSGIAEKDIRSSRVSAQPQYEWSNSKQIYKGERVSRSLMITVNDLDALPSLMQGVIDKGASTIDGVIPGFQNPQALEQEALGLAANDAKRKAEFLAKSLGRTLGQAFQITEQSDQTNPVIGRMQESKLRSLSHSASPEPPKEMLGIQSIKASIHVHFYLL